MRFVDPQPNHWLQDWIVDLIGVAAVAACLLAWPLLFAAMFGGMQ